jgi:uracil-DNA glycosylase
MQSINREVQEVAAQVRSLLEDLKNLGIAEVSYIPQKISSSPVGEGGMEEHSETLEEIRADLGDCRRCPLWQSRKNIVFGAGDPHARLVFVGEAPGREEDKVGQPFVGEAGRLLDRILFAMGMTREEIYICNVEKCRPPNNRDPRAEEIEACEPFLKRQLAAIRPQLIVALGRFAAQALLRDQTPISRLRGNWREYEGIPLMPTYHPAYLLRNPTAKREVWEDMKQVMKRLQEEIKK